MKDLFILLLATCSLHTIFTQNDVRLPPTIRLSPESKVIKIYKIYDNVTLECRAVGTPAVRYEWKKNGFQLNTNFVNIHRGSDGTITINRATEHDEGYYQCSARNQYGTALSDMISIRMAFIDTGPRIPAILQQTVIEGIPFRIPANRQRSFPEPSNYWVKLRSVYAGNNTQSNVDRSERMQFAENGDLYVAYALPKDADGEERIYWSLSQNPFLDVSKWGGATQLTVTRNPEGQISDFTPTLAYSSPSQTVALIGGSVTFRCFFFGYPTPKISWILPVSAVQSLRIQPHEHDAERTIRRVTASDEGECSCTGTNTQGNTTHTFQIRVEAAPKFQNTKNGLNDVNVTEGESVTFNCNASAKPEASIVWLQNGHPINTTNPPKRFAFGNGLKSLTIRDVCRDCVDRESKTDLMVIQCNASNVHGYAFSQGYLNVLRSYSSTFLEGNDATESWSQPNTDDSFDKKFRDLLEMVNNLKGDALNQAVVAKIVRQLSALTNNSEVLSPENRNASVMILKQLTVLIRVSNIRLNATEIEAIIQAISNVLEDVDKITVTDIWLIMDDFGLILANMRIPGPGHIAVYKDNLVLAAWAFEMSNSSLQIEFPNGSLWGENRGDRISISMETLNGSILTENSTNWKMWGVYYRNIHENLPGKNDTDDVVNSRVISFSIVGLKTNETLKPPVLITLQHNEEKARSYRRTCGFLNSNRSGWDSFGCSVTSTNKTHTICSCDHLTNFAILMSRNPVYDTKLSLISIIGCNISVAALLLTVIIYAVTWKHAKSSQAALLLNLCIALIVAYIIFMAGADKVEFSGYSMVGCHVVAVLMHYFFLVAFFIMLAEGVDMVLYIFFVFHVRRTRETIMLIAAAWVLPMIIVGVSLGVTRLEGYGHDEACWLSSEKGLIWAFIGPVLCIIAINLVILIIILRLISKKKAILAKNSRKREEIRATIWNLSVMCPVLGLGWLFGVFSVFFDHVAFQYVFVIANSMHGLLIFIIYALFHNKKMNETISAVYSQYRKTDSSGSNHMNNSSQEHSTNSTANIRTTRPSLQPKSSDSDEFGTKAEVSTHNSGLKDSLLENKAEIHQETAFDHR